jgi:hypothetical protein
MVQYLTRSRETLQQLAVGQKITATSQEVTDVFNFIGE